MVEKPRLDPAAALASERLFLSLSPLAGWRSYESRSELQRERCLCEAEGWGRVGWEGGGSCTLASPTNAGGDSHLSPKPRIASLPLLRYLFILVFYSIA